MYQLELFETIDDTTNPVWNQMDRKIQKEIVTRLGQLVANVVQEKAKHGPQKEDEHDNEH